MRAFVPLLARQSLRAWMKSLQPRALNVWSSSRVATHRNEKNSLTFPWSRANFTDLKRGNLHREQHASHIFQFFFVFFLFRRSINIRKTLKNPKWYKFSWFEHNIKFPWPNTKFTNFSLTLKKFRFSLTFHWPWQPYEVFKKSS